jgi:hypothetical protein
MSIAGRLARGLGLSCRKVGPDERETNDATVYPESCEAPAA